MQGKDQVQNLEEKGRLEVLGRAGGQANKARKTTKRGSGIVYGDGSGVEMQAENIESMQEEGVPSGQEYHGLDVSPRKQERVPLAESSKKLCRGIGVEAMYRALSNGWVLYRSDEIRGAGSGDHSAIFFIKGLTFLNKLLCMMLYYWILSFCDNGKLSSPSSWTSNLFVVRFGCDGGLQACAIRHV